MLFPISTYFLYTSKFESIMLLNLAAPCRMYYFIKSTMLTYIIMTGHISDN